MIARSILTGLVALLMFMPAGAIESPAAESLRADVSSDVRVAGVPTGQGQPVFLWGAGQSQRLRQIEGVTGEGIVIAIVDTGVDPAHRDLIGADGQSRIVDWVDISGEGHVRMHQLVTLGSGQISTPLGSADLRGVQSKSGRVWIGVLSESQLDGGGRIQRDLDRNGRSDDQFLVVVSDSRIAGRYDMVYVDTNRSLRVTSGDGMGEFRTTGDVRYFGTPGQYRPGTAFVASRIAASGSSVTLGFDGNGHGTHVAGIAAAAGADRGGMTGVAPGASILSVKALGSSGHGSWDQIKAGIEAAAELGANIIAVSITPVAGKDTLPDTFLRQLSDRYGVLIVVAVGNNGPGLGSAMLTSEPASTIVVGGYVPSAAWRDAYDYHVPGDTIWYFSAVGPDRRAGLGPDVVAPAIALSTAPSWEGVNAYELLEGSSMAVPHVVGTVALLLEAAKNRGIKTNPALIREAVLRGAVPLSGYTDAEQGRGVVDAVAAWNWLRRTGRALTLPVTDMISSPGPVGDPGILTGQGVYGREILPASVDLRLRSPWQSNRMSLVSTGEWLVPRRSEVNLAAGAHRTVGFDVDPALGPGLHTARIQGTYGGKLGVELPVTLVVPHVFNADNRQVWLEGELQPARYRREYVKVPPGSRALSVQLSVPRTPDPQGRVRMHLFGPDGTEVYLSPFVGAPDRVDLSTSYLVENPEPGVWEVVVYSSAALSTYRLSRSRYVLEAGVEFMTVTEPTGGVIALPAGSGSVSLQLQNSGRAIQAHPLLLCPPGSPPVIQTERVHLTRGSSVTRVIGDIGAGTQYLRVAIGQPTDAAVDLDLYLYRQLPGTKEWAEVARSSVAGTSNESVDLVDPIPGRYIAYVDARHQMPDLVTFTMEATTVSGAVRLEATPRWLTSGQSMQVVLPPGQREGLAHLLITDHSRGQLAALVSVVFQPSRPGLVVSVFPGILMPDTDTVTLHVRDASTHRPVDLPVRVNGRVYISRDGKVTVPVARGSRIVRLLVEIDDPRYRYFSRQYEVAPRAYDMLLSTPNQLKPVLEEKTRNRL